MTVTMIRVMIALGIIGHAINMYCDRILSIFPNGTIKFDNIKEIEKDGVLAEMMEGVPAAVPLRSAVLGAFALVLEFFSYFALAVYTFERSQILGGMMFVAITCSCILGAECLGRASCAAVYGGRRDPRFRTQRRGACIHPYRQRRRGCDGCHQPQPAQHASRDGSDARRMRERRY